MSHLVLVQLHHDRHWNMNGLGLCVELAGAYHNQTS